jgi:hypothetical protein
MHSRARYTTSYRPLRQVSTRGDARQRPPPFGAPAQHRRLQPCHRPLRPHLRRRDPCPGTLRNNGVPMVRPFLAPYRADSEQLAAVTYAVPRSCRSVSVHYGSEMAGKTTAVTTRTSARSLTAGPVSPNSLCGLPRRAFTSAPSRQLFAVVRLFGQWPDQSVGRGMAGLPTPLCGYHQGESRSR